MGIIYPYRVVTPDSISDTARPLISRRARLQTDKITGKPILLYPEGVLMLNATGQAITSLCDGKATFQQIAATLAARYNISSERIYPEAAAFLNRLRERNLLEWIEEGDSVK